MKNKICLKKIFMQEINFQMKSTFNNIAHYHACQDLSYISTWKNPTRCA